MNAYEELYKPLIGFTITDFTTDEIKNDPNKPWLIFEVTRGNEILNLVVSQDPEGNGGGFVFIEDGESNGK
tara:strand:+ start:5439 stop:5651 length:213 start_codon:yes stop_codon:yes gene_type:complete